MMIVDDATFNASLSKLQPSAQIINEEIKIITSLDLNELHIDKLEQTIDPVGKVVDITRGRGFGRLEVPEAIRKLAAEEALLGTPAKEVSAAFGVSESSVSAYKNGATSTASYNQPDKELKKSNDVVVGEVTSIARQKLSLALAEITSDKIKDQNVRHIAGIAKDMSAIVRNLEPNVPTNLTQNQVIVYKPRQNEEEDFEVITVNE